MKFANLSYHNKTHVSLGDQLQLLVFDYIYQQMGINRCDIVYIDKNELGTYNGEPVILPINMPLSDYCERGYAGRFSHKITPVFLGLTILKATLSPEEIRYFKQFEPIGCRDERTYRILQGYGISAYLGGCSSVVLPKRAQPDCKERQKVFIVDPPDGIREYIPEVLLENACFCTHILPEEGKSPREMAIERYGQYADEAALVITSLLHASVPCMAMGIPVILARDAVSYRFGWLEKLLSVYTPDEYGQINWSPAPVDYEPYKKFLLEFIQKRLRGEPCEWEIQTVHDFYMDRPHKEYIVDIFPPIQNYIDTMWSDPEKPYQYAVWGLTEVAEYTVDYISERYPNAKLCHVYDIAHAWDFRGIRAQHPDNLVKYPEETVFVTAYMAYAMAKSFFEKIGRPRDTYALCR